MSSANLVAKPLTPTQAELLRDGRAKIHKELQDVVGTSGSVEFESEPIRDISTGKLYDRFVVRARSKLSSAQKRELEALVYKCDYYSNDTRINVMIDRASYDTRWIGFNFTKDQRTVFYCTMFAAVCLLTSYAALDLYMYKIYDQESPFWHIVDEFALKQ